jgi:hypothetical protein
MKYITLSREQVAAALSDFFPRMAYKKDTVTQRCGWNACTFEVTWTVKKKGMVDWHPDLIDHIWKNDHYSVSCT